jgi:hypothetical protein
VQGDGVSPDRSEAQVAFLVDSSGCFNRLCFTLFQYRELELHASFPIEDCILSESSATFLGLNSFSFSFHQTLVLVDGNPLIDLKFRHLITCLLIAG